VEEEGGRGRKRGRGACGERRGRREEEGRARRGMAVGPVGGMEGEGSRGGEGGDEWRGGWTIRGLKAGHRTGREKPFGPRGEATKKTICIESPP